MTEDKTFFDDLEKLLGCKVICPNCNTAHILQNPIVFEAINQKTAISKCDCGMFLTFELNRYSNYDDFIKNKKINNYDNAVKGNTELNVMCDCKQFIGFRINEKLTTGSWTHICLCGKVYTLQINYYKGNVNNLKKQNIILSGKPKTHEEAKKEIEQEFERRLRNER